MALNDRLFVQQIVLTKLLALNVDRYLNKKKVAEEMEQQYQQTSSVDYSLKEGETLVLQIKTVSSLKSPIFTSFILGLNFLPFS